MHLLIKKLYMYIIQYTAKLYQSYLKKKTKAKILRQKFYSNKIYSYNKKKDSNNHTVKKVKLMFLPINPVLSEFTNSVINSHLQKKNRKKHKNI